jgi:UDP-N-acetyl-D-mannosaminuronic acid transferase (WecB/TagA/CpsF family)
VRFFIGSAQETVALGILGGLVVVPSAPVLVNAVDDPATQAALLESDMAITDSGLMILYWNLTRRENLRRVSGLEYLKLLLEEPALRKPGATLWVMPNETAIRRNAMWLEAQGFPVSPESFYLAPVYPAGPVTDAALLKIVEARKPVHIIMAIGGGVQERLGHYLKTHASYRPAIHCTGAAIGFLNGDQVRIPTWGDRYFLGWLFRCFRSPATFIPRYWKARKLVSLLWRFGERLPRRG